VSAAQYRRGQPVWIKAGEGWIEGTLHHASMGSTRVQVRVVLAGEAHILSVPHEGVRLDAPPREAHTFRGHAIFCHEQVWYYLDTLEPVSRTWHTRGCGRCGKQDTPEGHDGCLGTILGALNACCGHGEPGDAYIQFKDHELRGQAALGYLQASKEEEE